ncbi:MAG: hypothetical protein KDA85_05415, partial [Planctomycetaceae bacterium]|nr:hypothetical protein [Planctomycetaceae bacterium]
MNDLPPGESSLNTSLRSGLLQQDTIFTDTAYEEYRMTLNDALDRAERNEKRTGWTAISCFVIALGLMFVGGSQVVGSFDPTDKDATAVSITLAAIYAVSAIVAWLALASYFSRFRPRTRQAKENIR